MRTGLATSGLVRSVCRSGSAGRSYSCDRYFVGMEDRSVPCGPNFCDCAEIVHQQVKSKASGSRPFGGLWSSRAFVLRLPISSQT